jgi:hypothetical protein
MRSVFKNWNWGKGIALAIVLMCCGIIYIVYVATTYNYDMVIDNYYEEELKFNDQAAAIANAHQLSSTIDIQQDDNFLIVAFPKDCEAQEIAGTLQLYRASDASKDIIIPIQFVSGSVMTIPLEKTIKGNYHAIAQWTMNGKYYKIVKDFEIL